MIKLIYFFILITFFFSCNLHAQKSKPNSSTTALIEKIDKKAESIIPKVVEWRRDIHQHPELGNREVRTSALITEHLKALGLEVKTGVAKTGVIGILKGSKPGPVVALRADIDALPVTEETDIPFKSVVTTEYNGQQTGVMHACGHDTHTAMLMGVAEVLVSIRNELRGTVKFIFQPSEEGPPAGEEGGAKLMVKEGALENPKVDVIFGQHISSGDNLGTFTYRPGGSAAENDIFKITIHGRQSHGASPWAGVDPIVTGAQIVLGLQTIVSRNSKLTENAAVITVGAFHAGNRQNIIPSEAEMIGTIRTLDSNMRNLIHRRIYEVATNIAKSAGATADVEINMEDAMLYNDPGLTAEMVSVLQELSGKSKVKLVPAATGAEDFAYFAQKVPGFYFQVGAKPEGVSPDTIQHHTPTFQVDESSFIYGVKALCHLAINYMGSH
jgi:amidohydrolase